MMELVDLTQRVAKGAAEVVAQIRGPATTFELYFRFPERYRDFLATGPEPFLCALLVPAMSLGVPLRSRLPASPTLLRGFRRAQAALQSMYPDLLRIVAVEAEPCGAIPPRKVPRMASFFSGGVDSFYTVLGNLQDPKPGYPPLTHAVFMRGLETELEREEGVSAAAALAREATTGLGLEFVEGESNLRSHFPIRWDAWCGTALAGTAHALGHGFTAFLIPAGAPYWYIAPPGIGSHPLIEEACRTESLRIHCDGAHCNRPYKVANRLAGSSIALRYLRVCTTNRGGPDNCGTCSKCLLNMLALEAAGVLDRVRTLPRLPRDWYRRKIPTWIPDLADCLAIARIRNRPRSFLQDLERLIRRIRFRNAVRELFEASGLRWFLPAIRTVRPRLRGPFGGSAHRGTFLVVSGPRRVRKPSAQPQARPAAPARKMTRPAEPPAP